MDKISVILSKNATKRMWIIIKSTSTINVSHNSSLYDVYNKQSIQQNSKNNKNYHKTNENFLHKCQTNENSHKNNKNDETHRYIIIMAVMNKLLPQNNFL